MKKLAALSALVAVALVAPAQAAKPEKTDGSQKAASSAKAKKGKAKGRCVARAVGFNASGTLLEATMTAGTPGIYSGTIKVAVKKANHGAPKGEQTYTLTDVKVRFGEGVDAAAPAVGSRVKISGKIKKVAKKCSTEGFEPTVTVKRVDVKAAQPVVAEDEAKKADGDEAQTAGA
jgi:hypothetical protein